MNKKLHKNNFILLLILFTFCLISIYISSTREMNSIFGYISIVSSWLAFISYIFALIYAFVQHIKAKNN